MDTQKRSQIVVTGLASFNPEEPCYEVRSRDGSTEEYGIFATCDIDTNGFIGQEIPLDIITTVEPQPRRSSELSEINTYDRKFSDSVDNRMRRLSEIDKEKFEERKNRHARPDRASAKTYREWSVQWVGHRGKIRQGYLERMGCVLHSSVPNAYFVAADDKIRSVSFYAKKPIKCGEEISINKNEVPSVTRANTSHTPYTMCTPKTQIISDMALFNAGFRF